MAKKEIKPYEEYLNSINKVELIDIINTFNIEYNKSFNKDELIKIISDNLGKIVSQSLDIFQSDELQYIKYVIKHNGELKVKINPLLLKFIETLLRNGLMFEIESNHFIMPKEVLNLYKKNLKKKSVISKIKSNTREYNIILGFLDTYGIIDFKTFYDEYSKDYKLSKDEAASRITFFVNFFREFQFIKKEKLYLASNDYILDIKDDTVKLIGMDYQIYSNEQILQIHNLTYLDKYKSYKKLKKFLKKNYYMDESNMKVFNKLILRPYLNLNQVDKENASLLLSSLINTYFEFRNDRLKDKFVKLMIEVTLDYPRWQLKGRRERDEISR